MKNTVQARQKGGTKSPSSQVQIPSTPAGHPVSEAQQSFNLRVLEQSIQAAGSLLLLLGEKSEDRGLAILADNTALKLNEAFTTVSLAFIPTPKIQS
jgi:hypothetical protein